MDFLNLYMIKDLKTGKLNMNFFDVDSLKDFIEYVKNDENKDIKDYAIYSLKLDNITKYLEI